MLVPPWPAETAVKQFRGHAGTYKVFSHRFVFISIPVLGVVYVEIQRIFNLCSSADDKAQKKKMSHDVANVHMSSVSAAQFTAFISALRTFINMTRGTFSPTHFLSHDIIGWSWQAPTSGLKCSICTDGGPVHVTVNAAAFVPQISLWDKNPWNFTSVQKSCARSHLSTGSCGCSDSTVVFQ